MIKKPTDGDADGSSVRFRILGPVEILKDDVLVPLRSARQQRVLAVLLLDANQVVGTGQLVDAVWPDQPPSTARSQIQICVSALRHLLDGLGAGDLISTQAPGYVLRLAPGQLDVHQFEKMVAEASTIVEAGRLDAAAICLRSALALWSGPALNSVPSPVVQAKAAGLDERRLGVVEDCLELELQLGKHRELTGELMQLVEENPLRERLRGQLMLALYRSGRQVEALDVYRDARSRLIEQLGIEPGDDLRELESAILANDTRLRLPAAVRSEPAKPRQLVSDIGDFTGRAEHIARISRLIAASRPQGGGGAAVPVAVVVGKGGVGKSALAVHIAHRLVPKYFPDGQLYTNLRGSHPSPLSSVEVLGRSLRALGVSGSAIGDSLEERAQLYRSRLAGQQVLVVLDDAEDEEQIRPLLPGSSSCAVIVTSRSRLTGLPGGHLVDLDVFDQEQALDLLEKIVGQAQVRAQPAAAIALVRLVGGLPLALRIAGARLAAHPHWRLSAMVNRLADERRRLDELAHGQLDVRASISWAYNGLPASVRTLFRLLSDPDMSTFPSWVAAAVQGVDTREAEDQLEQLVDAQLLDIAVVEEPGGFRYRFHTLTRIFAREKLEEIPPRDRLAARERLVGGWLSLVEDAHQQLYGGQYTLLHGTGTRWRPASGFAELPTKDPLGWLESERTNLCAAVRLSAEARLSELSWDLAMALVTLFESRSYLQDWEQTHEVALAAARAAGNHRGVAAMLASLGSLQISRRRVSAAFALLDPALALFERLGDRHGHALTLRTLAMISYQAGAADLAMSRYETALAELRAADDLVGVAHVLTNIAQILLDRGDPERATGHLDEALRISRAVGSRRIEAQVLYRLGGALLAGGRHAVAYEVFTSVLRLVEESADRSGQSYARLGLGQAGIGMGAFTTAEADLRGAMAICDDIADRAGGARVRLELGRFLLDRGDELSARHYLAAALATFHEQDLKLWQDRATESLRQLDGGRVDLSRN
jgi:DNA-binding SARP family transcriptional activator/tetratricopeptide (TPR) repeat protein